MTTLTIEFRASTQLLRKDAVETGDAGKVNRILTFDLALLKEDVRAKLMPHVTPVGSNDAPVSFKIALTERQTLKTQAPDFSPQLPGSWLETERPVFFDTTPTLAEVIAFCEANQIARRTAEILANVAKQKAEEDEAERKARAEAGARLQRSFYDSQIYQVTQLINAGDLLGLQAIKWTPGFDPHYTDPDRPIDLGRVVEQEISRLAQVAERKERLEWAEQFGSSHLRRALRAGHPATFLYFKERAAREYPGARLDFAQAAKYQTPDVPSKKALDKRDQLLADHGPDVNVTIVMLTVMPEEREDPEGYAYGLDEPIEGIVVDDNDYPCEIIFIL